MSNITVVALSTINAVKLGHEIYREIYLSAAKAMDAAEVELTSSGSSKKSLGLGVC